MLFCRCFLEYLIHKECSKSKNKRETVLKHSSVIFNIKKKKIKNTEIEQKNPYL